MHEPDPEALLAAALAWHDAGASVLPAATGKMPALPWKDHQTERLARQELADWLTGHDGIGIVTGYNGYEMLELEGRVSWWLPKYLAALPEALVHKITTYMERTPSGGWHFVYRVDETQQGGSTRLARTSDGLVAIETRGRFAWTVMAPSGGRVHPDGGEWKTTPGCSPGHVPTLTEEERAALFDAARDLDEMPPPPPVEHRPAVALLTGKLSPGQDYEQRADWMADILGPEGWTTHSRDGDKMFLTRPGKRFGKSATLNYDGNDNLYVFTSSTDFPPETSWTKFGAYAFLHHDSDYAAAAKELRAQGYGSPPEPPEKIDITDLIPEQADEPPEDSSSGPAPITLTDEGNAQLLVQAERHRLRYCPERSDWMAWDGARWMGEGEAAAVQAFLRVIGKITPRTPAELKHYTSARNWPQISRAITLARNLPEMIVHADELDARAHELNAPNGVVDLLTAELLPPHPDRLHSRMTGVPIDFDTDCPRWLAFLRETFDGDEEMIEFVQRALGYSAIGLVTEHVLPFLHGAGANGKSVFMEVAMGVLGDYAGPMPADFLLAGANVHESYVADLQGKRLVVCSEVGPSAKFHEQRIKIYTGGDQIKGRWLYGKPFLFTPTHTLWLMGNHQPRVDAGGESFWRRLRLVPFTRTVPVERRIAGLAQQLVAEEGPAILAWIVRGAAKAAKDGLKEPASVKAATSAYAEEEDQLARFCEERLRFGGGTHVRVTTADMRHAYEQWCFAEGEKAIPAHVFGREMKARGALPVKSNGKRAYSNVTIMRPDEVEVPDSPEQLRYKD